ncbi:hypothetical protein ADUPG1_013238 [Aduncisulcus paluster]|uniref:Integrase catalytic domain-containing protein n=1 Tax=Aduncisulcus paluster TaxID=2918883 RepID=A0ABQ5K277_9EUKA|nr:hypothetical protein ADUPG1_013238 [Aduncisulcus paluster]
MIRLSIWWINDQLRSQEYTRRAIYVRKLSRSLHRLIDDGITDISVLGFTLLTTASRLLLDGWELTVEKPSLTRGPQNKASKPTSKKWEACPHCGRKGHDVDHCWKLHPELRHKRLRNSSSNEFTLQMGFGRGHCMTLVDTGSECNLVHPDTLKKLAPNAEQIPCNHKIQHGKDSYVSVTSCVETTVSFTSSLGKKCTAPIRSWAKHHGLLEKYEEDTITTNGIQAIDVCSEHASILLPILSEFEEVFSPDIHPDGSLLPAFSVELTNPKAIWPVKPRRLSPADDAVLRENLECGLRDGILVKAASPYVCSPTFVDKPEGGGIKESIKASQKDFTPEELRAYESIDGVIVDKHERLVIPKTRMDIKKQVFEAFHNAHSGHHGATLTQFKIQENEITWASIATDLRKWVKTCVTCQKIRGAPKKRVTRFRSEMEMPFHTICVDTMGPFPASSDGTMYIIVIVDRFSRWVELHPAKSLEAKEASTAIMERIVSRFGVPRNIISDGGSQYSCFLTDHLWDTFGVKHHVTTPAHSQSNGAKQVFEAFHNAHSGHHGATLTQFKIQENEITWASIATDLRKWVKTCVTCQKIRGAPKKRVTRFRSEMEMPFHTICVDTMGPFQRPRMVLSKEASTAIMERIVSRFGVPRNIISDGGSQYSCFLTDHLWDTFGVKHHVTTPAHSQSNGAVEQVNREVKRHLYAILHDILEKEDWHLALPVVMNIINNTPHTVTGHKPYDVLFGIREITEFSKDWSEERKTSFS